MMGLFFPIFIVGLASWVNAGYNVGVGRADITGPAAEVFAIILRKSRTYLHSVPHGSEHPQLLLPGQQLRIAVASAARAPLLRPLLSP